MGFVVKGLHTAQRAPLRRPGRPHRPSCTHRRRCRVADIVVVISVPWGAEDPASSCSSSRGWRQWWRRQHQCIACLCIACLYVHALQERGRRSSARPEPSWWRGCVAWAKHGQRARGTLPADSEPGPKAPGKGTQAGPVTCCFSQQRLDPPAACADLRPRVRLCLEAPHRPLVPGAIYGRISDRQGQRLCRYCSRAVPLP